MTFDVKKTAGVTFLICVLVGTFLWLIFGWLLVNFRLAPVFQTINTYGLKTWLFSPLAFKTPVVMFWYIILGIFLLLFVVSLVSRVIVLVKTPTARPVYRGFLIAIYVLASLLIFLHIADVFATSRITRVKVADGGKVSFRDGLEISLDKMTFVADLQYLNLPLKVYPHDIPLNRFNIKDNKILLGVSKPGLGVTHYETYMTNPLYLRGLSLIVENFYSDEDYLYPAGVSLTLSRKPLLPFIIAFYILLAVSMLGIIYAPRFDKPAPTEPVSKLPPKTPATSGMTKKKKKKH